MNINKKLYVAGVLFLALLIISLSAYAFATAPGKEPVQPLVSGINCPDNGEDCGGANCTMKEDGACSKGDGACAQNGACPKDEACTMKDANTCQMGEKKPDCSMVAAPAPEHACSMGGGGMGGACQRKRF